jgi:hypothetical protein
MSWVGTFCYRCRRADNATAGGAHSLLRTSLRAFDLLFTEKHSNQPQRGPEGWNSSTIVHACSCWGFYSVGK